MNRKLSKAKQAERAMMMELAEWARERASNEPTPENREAAREASKMLSAWVMENDPPKVSSFASRAGKRQNPR